MVGVEVVGDIAVDAGPGGEGGELGFGLGHIAVEIVEVTESGSTVMGVGVGGVEAFVVLDVDEDLVLAGEGEELEVVGQELGGGLGDEDMVFVFDGVFGDGVVGCVGGEDGDGAALGKGVDGGLVGVWV